MTASLAEAAPPSWWLAELAPKPARPSHAPEPAPEPAPVVAPEPVPMPAPEPAHSAPDDFEERAAIIEEGTGIPRAWAEGFAKLTAMPPPTGFGPDRWK